MKGTTMRFWTREVAGWLLVILGLYLFYRCFELLTGPSHGIVEAGLSSIVGIFIFRGGIHLLKVATAAEICMSAGLAKEEKRSPGFDRGLPDVLARKARF
jgi:hypothetical protein